MSAIVPSEIVRFIDRVFPDLNHGYGVEYSGLYLGLSTMVDQLDSSVLPADPQLRSELTAAVSHIRFQVQIWISMGSGTRTYRDVPGFKSQSALAIIRRIMEQCPDSLVPQAVQGLEFVADQQYRETLRSDLSEVETNINSHQWKAATVLGGSFIEAILLDSLKIVEAQAVSATLAPNKPLENWDLKNYLNVAQELQIIGPTAYKWGDDARDFRNFIHPGKSLREAKDCTMAVALGVRAALQHVLEDLEAWHLQRTSLGP